MKQSPFKKVSIVLPKFTVKEGGGEGRILDIQDPFLHYRKNYQESKKITGEMGISPLTYFQIQTSQVINYGNLRVIRRRI